MNEPVDFSEVIAKTDVEMKRLGWTHQRGREYLIRIYGKRGRTLLTEQELLDFVRYLEYLPTPEESTPSKVTPLNKSSAEKTTNKATKTSTSKSNKNKQPVNLSEVIAKTDVEMERLGWTAQQGREYLIQTYGKRGRTLLTVEELLGFLKYLESLPTETDPLAGF